MEVKTFCKLNHITQHDAKRLELTTPVTNEEARFICPQGYNKPDYPTEPIIEQNTYNRKQAAQAFSMPYTFMRKVWAKYNIAGPLTRSQLVFMANSAYTMPPPPPERVIDIRKKPTQKQIAQILGISQQEVSRRKKLLGIKHPTVADIRRYTPAQKKIPVKTFTHTIPLPTQRGHRDGLAQMIITYLKPKRITTAKMRQNVINIINQMDPNELALSTYVQISNMELSQHAALIRYKTTTYYETLQDFLDNKPNIYSPPVL